MISEISKCFLTVMARRCLNAILMEGKTVTFEDDGTLPEELRGKTGAFVSLWRYPEGDPRASHGDVHPDVPLAELVLQSLIGCVAHETVFPRLTKDELNKVTIRIHLLGERTEARIAGTDTIEGCALYLRYRRHSAIFLPEIIRLAGWDLLESASQLCLKAGVPGDMWLSPETTLEKIDIHSFGESRPGDSEVRSF